MMGFKIYAYGSLQEVTDFCAQGPAHINNQLNLTLETLMQMYLAGDTNW